MMKPIDEKRNEQRHDLLPVATDEILPTGLKTSGGGADLPLYGAEEADISYTDEPLL